MGGGNHHSTTRATPLGIPITLSQDLSLPELQSQQGRLSAPEISLCHDIFLPDITFLTPDSKSQRSLSWILVLQHTATTFQSGSTSIGGFFPFCQVFLLPSPSVALTTLTILAHSLETEDLKQENMKQEIWFGNIFHFAISFPFSSFQGRCK